MREAIKRVLPYIYAALILFAIDLFFLSEQLNGSILIQADMDNAIGMRQEALQFYERTGQTTYWTNAMFGGMPTYQIWGPAAQANIYDFIINLIGLFTDDAWHYFYLLTFGSFLALCLLGIGPWLALMGSFAITFSTNHIGLLTAGHLTKMSALAFVPMILVGAILIFRKKWLQGIGVYTFGLAACISQNHIQMTYYVMLGIMIYLAIEVFQYIKSKNFIELNKIIGCFAAGTLIAVLVNFSLIFSLKDYVKDTMRGGAVLSVPMVRAADSSMASSESGLGWDYAMQWSNGHADLLGMLAPGAIGGSSNEKWSGDSKFGKSLKAAGYTIGEEMHMPLYWGSLPFTSTPDYMGILIVLFFIIGLWIIPGPLKWFALGSTLFFILLSLGKNFGFINRVLFDYLPYYDKFRAPNSILNVLSCILPVFAMLGLYQFIQQKWNLESLQKLFVKSLIPLASILIFLIVLGPFLFNMKNENTDVNWQSNPTVIQSILDARIYFLRYDSLRSLLLLLGSGALLYIYVSGKLNKDRLLMGLGLILFIDLWTVSGRYLDEADFRPKGNPFFETRASDKVILEDSSLNFRVFDLSINTFGSAYASYFHKTIGGHHAAKLRRYQDMIDYYFSRSNQKALDLMNTKYVINEKGSVSVNPGALGNAWFVSSIKPVNTPDEEISSIASVNPGEEALILMNEFPGYTLQTSFAKSGTITLTDYKPNHLTYKTQTSVEQLAVFSEIWYGPDKGWQAYIDGKEVDHIRADYILRAMKIPAGQHSIEFKFNPTRIVAYNKFTWFIKMLFGVLVLAFLCYEIRIWWKALPQEDLSLQPVENKSQEIIKKANKKKK